MKPKLIVKVGTSTLLDNDELPSRTFDSVAKSVRGLRTQYDIVLVTSGAIGFGARHMGISRRPKEVAKLQALSAIGQLGLMRRWREAFGDQAISQVLLTARELATPDAATSVIRTINELWSYGVVPVVNENDVITSEEITFGDNDMLAAQIAEVLGADYLVLLTDQDGIQADFGAATQRRLEVVSINEVMEHVVPGGSEHSSGGIQSKVRAAEIALERDITAYIAHARHSAAVERALSGDVGTKLVQ